MNKLTWNHQNHESSVSTRVKIFSGTTSALAWIVLAFWADGLQYVSDSVREYQSISISSTPDISTTTAIKVVSTTAMWIVSEIQWWWMHVSLNAEEVYGGWIIWILSAQSVWLCTKKQYLRDCWKVFSYVYNN